MKELGDYIQAKDPTVTFLAETWTDDARLDQVLRNFDFRNKWSAASGNRGGGLVLLWKEEIRITVEDSSKYCIDVLVENNAPQEWRFTGFYGEPVTAKRHEARSKFRTLNDKPHIPWLCAGISMKSQDKKKRWEEQFVHIVKCKLSRNSLTNADIWIWVFL